MVVEMEIDYIKVKLVLRVYVFVFRHQDDMYDDDDAMAHGIV